MFSLYLVLGFSILFFGIGFVVFHRNDFLSGQNERFVARILLLALSFFLGFYGIGFSYLIRDNHPEISGIIRILACFTLVCFLFVLTWTVLALRKNHARLKELWHCFLEILNKKSRDENDGLQEATAPGFSVRDGLFMTLLTLGGAVLIFFRLGSFHVPESFLILDATKERGNEIVLDFGEETDIKELSLFLGHMEERTIAVSYYDEDEEAWQVIQEDSMAESVYRWGTIEVNQKLRYLGLVARDRQAVFNELVIFNENGDKLLPVNSARYPELFDEQELYPVTNSYYYGTMFDEIYYSRSAYELLQGMDTYEWTHPPLSKIFMAAGVYLFGVTPFGWRCVCALAGVLVIPVIYLWALRLTGQTRYAAIAGALVTLDFMHLTLSRIATIDSIVALFILFMFTLMYYQLSRWKQQILQGKGNISPGELLYILIGAVMTGTACACKWTGFYAAAGIALLFFVTFLYVLYTYRGNRVIVRGAWLRFVVTGVSYVAGLLSIYVASYIPMARVRGVSVWQAAWLNSLDMFRFHSVITFDHPYESPWYSWLFDWVPLVDTGAFNEVSGRVSMVVTMGNPVIWWCGFAAFVYVLYRACFLRDKKAGYLSIAYLSMLVPWMFITRTVFIYQYYACALILSGILSYSLPYLKRRWKNVSVVLLEAALVCFILFYPIISGIEVNAETIKTFMEWLPRWHFVG
ncbi:MAG: phospholipid carrier-dependent glycosyltransferase [Lachnospiraceae bacterium]|nr:phospholipid carrier-dependent glycosyltransferase [Lachnospiraceae bacterium]